MRLPPPDMFDARGTRLVQAFADASIDVLVVTSLPNIAYLTGFFASAASLVATPEAFHLVSDGRYVAGLEARGHDWSRLRTIQLGPGQSYDEAIAAILLPLRGLRVGVDFQIIPRIHDPDAALYLATRPPGRREQQGTGRARSENHA